MTESIKVRRYVPSDIGRILELARRASENAGIAFDEARFKFVLDNNVRNVHLCCLVLVDLIEIVGVLIAQQRKSIMNNDMIAETDFLHTEIQYGDGIKLIMADYINWAKERGCKEVRATNVYMPGTEVSTSPSYTVYKETL